MVRAKSDLPSHPEAGALPESLGVSALSGHGLDVLLEHLTREAEQRAGAAGDEGGVVASLRQLEILDALSLTLRSGEAALGELPLEAALVDLKLALDHVGAILGVDVGDAVLDRIFSAFCLGK